MPSDQSKNGLGFPRFAGLVGVIAALFGISAVLASTFLCGVGCGEEARAWNEWGSDGSFSWSINALSDLGVSEVADLFNYPLVIVGILNFIFATGFMKAYAKGMLFYLGGAVVVLGGGSLSLVGVFTEATGALHGYVSLGYFLLVPIGIVLVGLAFVRTNMHTKGYGSLLAGLAALLVIVGGITPGWHRWLGLGFAVPEFVEAVVIGAWYVWMGVGLMRLRPQSVP